MSAKPTHRPVALILVVLLGVLAPGSLAAAGPHAGERDLRVGASRGVVSLWTVVFEIVERVVRVVEAVQGPPAGPRPTSGAGLDPNG